MASYQDIETRLQQVERKVEFTMRAFTVVNKLNPFGPQLTLLDLYHTTQQFPQALEGELVGETVDTNEFTPPEDVKE